METVPSNGGPEAADIETASDGYANRFKGPVGNWMLARQARFVLDLLPPCPARILDVGGGHAQLARPLSAAGYDVTVQGSAPQCQNRISDLIQSKAVQFTCSPFLQLPFPDASFEAVVSVRLLSHCETWGDLIREMTRVARDRVVVDYPTPSRLQQMAPVLFRVKKRLEGNTRTWISFTDAEVEAAFKKVGWRRLARVGQFIFPMVIHRALRCRPISAALERVGECGGLSRRWGTPVIAAFERDIKKSPG